MRGHEVRGVEPNSWEARVMKKKKNDRKPMPAIHLYSCGRGYAAAPFFLPLPDYESGWVQNPFTYACARFVCFVCFPRQESLFSVSVFVC